MNQRMKIFAAGLIAASALAGCAVEASSPTPAVTGEEPVSARVTSAEGTVIAEVVWSPATQVARWTRGKANGEMRVARFDAEDARRFVEALASQPSAPDGDTPYITCGHYFGCAEFEIWGSHCNVCSFIDTACNSGMAVQCSDQQDLR